MNYKEITREFLLKKYEEVGRDRSIRFAMEMLKSKNHKDDLQFTADLHGEICECVLEIMIEDYRRTHPTSARDWKYCKSVVLKNRNGLDRDFLTEIDFVLMTPECMYLFECKSYSGDKELTGAGKLTRTIMLNGKTNKRSCDVYSQSVIHKDTFYDWIAPFVVKGKEPVVQMCMFDFSLGELVDRRSRASKIEMPCLNCGSVLEYITQPGEVVWDARYFGKLEEKLNMVSAKLRTQHLKYVQSLHRGR